MKKSKKNIIALIVYGAKIHILTIVLTCAVPPVAREFETLRAKTSRS